MTFRLSERASFRGVHIATEAKKVWLLWSDER